MGSKMSFTRRGTKIETRSPAIASDPPKPLHVQSGDEKSSGEIFFSEGENSLLNPEKEPSAEVNDKLERNHNNPRKRSRKRPRKRTKTQARMEETAGKAPVIHPLPNESDITEPKDTTVNSTRGIQVERSAEGGVRKKRGRPPKKHKILNTPSETEHKILNTPSETEHSQTVLKAVEAKESDVALSGFNASPLKTSCVKDISMKSSSTSDVDIGAPLNDEPVLSEEPTVDSLPQHSKPPDSTPVVLKRKRGRPRKNTTSGVKTADSGTPPVGATVSDSVKPPLPPQSQVSDEPDGRAADSAGKLRRNRGTSQPPTSHPPTSQPPTSEGQEPSEANISIPKGISRRPKISKKNITDKAARLRSTDKDDKMCRSSADGDRVESSKPRKRKQMKREDVAKEQKVKADLPPLEDVKPRVGRSQEKTTVVRQMALAMRRLRSNVAAVTYKDVPAKRQKISRNLGDAVADKSKTDESHDFMSPLDSDVYSPQAVSAPNASQRVKSAERSSRSAEILSKVKTEDVEIELGDYNSESNGLMSLQCYTDNAKFPISNCEDAEFKKKSKVDKRRGNFKILKDAQDVRTETQRKPRSRAFGKRRKRKRSWWDNRGSLQSVIDFKEDPEANGGGENAQEGGSDGNHASKRKDGASETDSVSELDVVNPDTPDTTSVDSPSKSDTPLVEETEHSGKDEEPREKRRRHRGARSFECEDCGRCYKYMSLYIIHRRSHTGERPYRCPDCGRGFAQHSNFKTHCKKCKSEQRSVGKIKMSTADKLRVHCETHVKKDEDDDETRASPKPIQNAAPRKRVVSSKGKAAVCSYCGKVFRFTSALRIHLRVHTGEKPYSCQVCGKSFSQAHVLRNHEVTHWSVKPYSCNKCGKGFVLKNLAERHICRSSDKWTTPSLSYTCHVCKQVFVTYNQYNAHLQTHTGAKVFCCSRCDQLFGEVSEYNAHCQQCSHGEKTASRSMFSGRPRADSRQRSYSQPSLPSIRGPQAAAQQHPPPAASHPDQQFKPRSTSFASLQNSEPSQPIKPRGQRPPQPQPPRNVESSTSVLPFQTSVISSHQFSHFVSKLNKLDRRSDPRKYLCPRCGRLFRHMGRLRAHMLTHARDQTYTCGRCGKTLDNWRKLWRHQSVHRQRAGRFTCPQCGRGFRFVGSYMKHMKEHPEYQWIQQRPNRMMLGAGPPPLSLPYQCEECDASFHALDLLFSHQLCHSPPQETDNGNLYLSSKDAHSGGTVTINPHANSFVANPRPEPHPPSYYPPPSVQSRHSPGSSSWPHFPSDSAEPSNSVPSPFQGPSVQQGLVPTNSPLHTQLKTFPRPHRNEITVFGKSIRKYEKKTQKVNRDSIPSIRTRESDTAGGDIKCVECGLMYSAISDLYDHYLQHARGEL